MKFSIKDFFSKCDQISRNLRIWSHLLKKSLMENFIFCAVIEFLGVTLDSLIMTLTIPEKKVSKVQKQSLELLQKTQVSILELTKPIGLLNIQAVLLAQINFRYLEQQQIQALRAQGVHREELQWWIQNLNICNGRYFIQSYIQVLIQTDAPRKGWGVVCQGISTGGQWSKEEQLLHINVLELKAVKLTLLTFNKQKSLKAQFISNRQHHCTTLSCENGGNREPNVTEIKERNLAVSLETPDHDYCRIPSKFFDCGGRLTVSKQQGLIKMETLSKSISTSLPEEGNGQSRFVCIKAVSPTTPVLCLETRPFQPGDRCPTTDLGQSIPL